MGRPILLWMAALPLLGCEAMFGPGDAAVIVPVARDERPKVPLGPMTEADLRDIGDRSWALLQLGEPRAAYDLCGRALTRAGGAQRARALLLYRCARAASALGDRPLAEELYRRSLELHPSPAVAAQLSRTATRESALKGALLAAVREKLAAIGVERADEFAPVDGPLVLGAMRAFSLERCTRPADLCEAAVVTLDPDGDPVDALRVPFGALPGSLTALPLSDPRARALAWKADIRSELRVALFLALRVDSGRLTPVALVRANSRDPLRAEKVLVRQDALVIDERNAPWDPRLRGFRGAPVASAAPD